MEASGKLSAKKIQKSIRKMSGMMGSHSSDLMVEMKSYTPVSLIFLANAEEVFEVLSSLRSDDLVRFLPSTMETKGLQQILAHYASIRPMGIVGRSSEVATFNVRSMH